MWLLFGDRVASEMNDKTHGGHSRLLVQSLAFCVHLVVQYVLNI